MKCAWQPHCETDSKKYEDFLKTFALELNYVSDKINFKKYGEKPVNKVLTPMDWIQFVGNAGRLKGAFIGIRPNYIETQDDLI